MGDVTQLIERIRSGERAALDALFDLLYPELHRIARHRLNRGARDTLIDTTALVHECYLKLHGAKRLEPNDRTHFVAYAATVMRSIIVDAARASRSQRRGGDAVHVTLDEESAAGVAAAEDEILDVHQALDELAQFDARLARVVEMRYFGGMSELDIASVLGVTERTVRRDWEKARTLLAATLRAPP